MPWAFKLDHLQPIDPLLFRDVFNLFIFILGSPILLPQKANYQKREFSQLQNWMRQRVFSALGIQTGPFAASGAHFVLVIFIPFFLHTGEPILITQEGQLSEKGVLSTPKLDETQGFQCLWHSNWTICNLWSPFCPGNFHNFSPSYWGAHS